MIPVIFDPDAMSEFLEAVRYYEAARPGLGRRFRLAAESAIDRIREAPFQFRKIHDPFRKCLLVKFPYWIIFSIEPAHIRIIAVAHTKRKPDYWSDRIWLGTAPHPTA